MRTLAAVALFQLVLIQLVAPRLLHAQSGSIDVKSISVEPASFQLTSSRQSRQLIVTGRLPSGDVADLTHQATYRVAHPDIADVAENGRLTPRKNGRTEVQVQWGPHTKVVAVHVTGQQIVEPVSFEHHTLPILAKSGCSGGACHGSPNGKAGFRLSLFGFEPSTDRDSLVREFQSRRVNPFDPDNSLLLKKPTMQIPHAGGRRLRQGTEAYRLLRDWIGQGGQTNSTSLKCVGIEVFPSVSRVLRFPNASQQFSVTARFSDGSIRDVTQLAQFSLSDVNVADVSPEGRVVGQQRGETAVIVRYLEFIQTPLLTFVRDVDGFKWNDPPSLTFVDDKVDEKLKQLQYLPSDICRDEIFLRRVFLDVIGLLPTPDEVRKFLADKSPEKRSRLIDQLLNRPEFAKFQAQKWGDLLRVSRKQIGMLSVFKYSRWLEGALSTMPYDQFARALITASGSTIENPAGNYYRTAADTVDAMETTAQLFLGSRIQCAKCHNHPFERWTQSDYYGMAAVFTRLDRQKTPNAEETRLVATETGEIRHPADGREMAPWVPILGQLTIDNKTDRREAFADWLTSRDNPFFARVEVNRIWAQVMGRGIVEPFDDFRDSNPPSNAPLLDALAADFIAHGYDRRHTFRVILNSRTYQSDSRPNKLNRDDVKYFSHYQPRRLAAEQLVDALGDVTGRFEEFKFVAPGTRATWLPAPDLEVPNRAKLGDIEFLKVFGQPERQSVCECDRGDDTSLGQALELLNGSFLHKKLESRDNRFHTAHAAGDPPKNIVIELYLRALSRSPTETELRRSLAYIDAHEDKALAMEDVCWSIVNKKEFLFQH